MVGIVSAAATASAGWELIRVPRIFDIHRVACKRK
jgi:hypothetical protein